MQVEEKLLNIARNVLKNDDIDINTTQSDVETWDSLAHIRLVMEVEKEFNVSIPMDDIAKIKSIKDFLKYLEGNGG